MSRLSADPMGTLDDIFRQLHRLYGPRNALHLRGDAPIKMVLDATRVLTKVLRKDEKDKVLLASALASLFARFTSYAATFGTDLPIVHSLVTKYPFGGCSYCNKPTCSCARSREMRPGNGSQIAPSLTHEQMPRDQYTWSINQWCLHLHAVYGTKNMERGIWFALGRFQEELSEAINVQQVDGMGDLSVDELQHRISLEFSDAFAWIFSMTAILGITDLHEVIYRRYSHCPRCIRSVCICASPFILTRSRPVLAETKVSS